MNNTASYKKSAVLILCIITNAQLLADAPLAKSTVYSPAHRITDHPIEPLILKRRSHYAFKRTLNSVQLKKKLLSLFEAARWAPSSYNNQPWRFIYALPESPQWKNMLELLIPFNQEWAKHGSALILVISKNNYEKNNKPSKTHSFDTGAAVQNLVLQATALDLAGHVIEGFDYEKARKQFKIPRGNTVEAMIVIGEPTNRPSKNISKEILERDKKATQRKKIEEFAQEGTFPAS